MIERYVFDPYGKATVLDADFTVDADGRSDVGNVVTYAGRDIDPLTGLYYNRRRWYDAGTGGMISPDPLGFAAGDANLYRYCGNSPLSYTDPSGLLPIYGGMGIVDAQGGGIRPPAGWTPEEIEYAAWWRALAAAQAGGMGGDAEPWVYWSWGTFASSLGSGLWNAGKGLAEPVLIIADIPHLSYDYLAGYTPEEITPWSMWGRYSRDRKLQGGNAWETLKEGAPPAAANVGTLGWYGYGRGAYEYYETGNPTSWQCSSSGPLLGSLALRQLLRPGAPGEALPPGFVRNPDGTITGTMTIDAPAPPTLPPGRGPYGPLEPPGIGPGLGRGPLGPIDRPWYPWWGAGHD